MHELISFPFSLPLSWCPLIGLYLLKYIDIYIYPIFLSHFFLFRSFWTVPPSYSFLAPFPVSLRLVSPSSSCLPTLPSSSLFFLPPFSSYLPSCLPHFPVFLLFLFPFFASLHFLLSPISSMHVSLLLLSPSPSCLLLHPVSPFFLFSLLPYLPFLTFSLLYLSASSSYLPLLAIPRTSS